MKTKTVKKLEFEVLAINFQNRLTPRLLFAAIP